MNTMNYRAFVKVVELGSITKAGQSIGLFTAGGQSYAERTGD